MLDLLSHRKREKGPQSSAPRPCTTAAAGSPRGTCPSHAAAAAGCWALLASVLSQLNTQGQMCTLHCHPPRQRPEVPVTRLKQPPRRRLLTSQGRPDVVAFLLHPRHCRHHTPGDRARKEPALPDMLK